jgi:hypothetical protein
MVAGGFSKTTCEHPLFESPQRCLSEVFGAMASSTAALRERGRLFYCFSISLRIASVASIPKMSLAHITSPIWRDRQEKAESLDRKIGHSARRGTEVRDGSKKRVFTDNIKKTFLH